MFTLCDPCSNCSAPGFPALPVSRSLLKLTSTESVMPSNHLILCRRVITNRRGGGLGSRQRWASASLSPSPRTPGLGSPTGAQGETLSSAQAKGQEEVSREPRGRQTGRRHCGSGAHPQGDAPRRQTASVLACLPTGANA